MSKESLEHLSSLMDGELSNEAGLFLTRRMSTDEALCDTWERYHLIRDCIRQPGSKQIVTGLSAKLNATLDEEDSPIESVRRPNVWLKPLSGLAIAASVALMAVVVTAPQVSELPAGNDTALSQPVNAPFVSPNNVSPGNSSITPVSQAASYAPQQADSNVLNSYLLRHNQVSQAAGRHGFVSYIPIVVTPASPVEVNAAETPESNSDATQPVTQVDAAEDK
jgi:sigma-E factor negative regulatory protein RseA